jgi:hypothetical protein
VRLGSPVAGFWRTFGLILAGLLATCIKWCMQAGT